MDNFEKQMEIRGLISDLCQKIDELESTDEKIETLNYVRSELHAVSPLKNHPVDCVLWVKTEDVEANDYNPNKIPPPEMELLYKSILEDGYTMSIVTFKDETDKVKIVDGFHRRLMIQIHEDIRKSTLGYVPLTYIRGTQEGRSDRMASTIRHNRARGVHNIELMSTIVAELVEMGKGDPWICKHIGMSIDELLRLKQITGLASLFNNKSFSQSWDPDEVDVDNIEAHEFEESKEED
jgi:ParB-like chromosome segregation protein Spo0J